MTWGAVLMVLGVIKQIINNEMVNRFFDHLTEGTKNTVDDQVWKALEWCANVPPHELPSHKENIETSLAGRQAWYDSLEETQREALRELREVSLDDRVMA